ncbi:MAG: CPBP family intramembrane glutamic endopeptidase [Thermonemataceae bacterium]
MRILFTYLRDYLRENFQVKLYSLVAAFLALLIYFNFKYDFEDSVIDALYKGKAIRMLWYFLLYAIPYYLVCGLIALFTDQKAFLKQKRFWFFSLMGLLILGFYRGLYVSHWIAEAFAPNGFAYSYYFRLSEKLKPLLGLLVPLLFVYFFWHRHSLPHFYGLRPVTWRAIGPYCWILLLMTPLIAWASFQPDFLQEYPTYQKAQVAMYARESQISPTPLIVLYEFAYMTGFFMIELFFRGFLVIGLIRFLGKEVVLPAAVIYCILHFGKPMAEAISSFFGGYILGVFAYKTENIYGGIIVHMGIALMMELFAFGQLAFK